MLETLATAEAWSSGSPRSLTCRACAGMFRWPAGHWMRWKAGSGRSWADSEPFKFSLLPICTFPGTGAWTPLRRRSRLLKAYRQTARRPGRTVEQGCPAVKQETGPRPAVLLGVEAADAASIHPLPVMRFGTQNRRVGRFAIIAYRRLAWASAAVVLMLATPLAAGRSRASRLSRSARPATGGNRPAAAAPSTAGPALPITRTVTAAGVQITNKRKIPVPSAAPEAAATSPAGHALAQPPGPAPGVPWWRRSAALVSGAFWFPMLGRLIRAGARTPLPIMSAADLGRYAWRRPACRQLLRDRPGRTEYVSELIDPAADESTGDWRLATIWWIKRHPSPSQIVPLVQAGLSGRGRTALADRRLILLLRLAAHAAAALPAADARDVLSVALSNARHGVDPYSANGLALVSRSVVSDLLEQRPELDEMIQGSLELQARTTRMEPGDPLPIEVRLLAIAVRNRAPDAGSALCRAAVKAGLGLTQIEAAARLADAPLPRRATYREPERHLGGADSRAVHHSLAAMAGTSSSGRRNWSSYTPIPVVPRACSDLAGRQHRDRSPPSRQHPHSSHGFAA